MRWSARPEVRSGQSGARAPASGTLGSGSAQERGGRCGVLGRDAGVAAPLVLALASVLALAGLVVASLAAVAVARQRAASAADLSAIAAAQSALQGEGPACARASALADRVAAALLSCRLEGDVAVVVAAVRPPGPLGRLGSATSQARAGPGKSGRAGRGPPSR